MTKPRKVTFQSERAQLRIARLIEILRGRKLSCTQILAELHCDRSLATEYLRHLRHDKPRRVRIAGYAIIDGSRIPMYQLGNRPDAPLTCKTNEERYARVKADPALYAAHIENARARHRAIRDAVPIEKRQRNRLTKDEALEPRILALLAKHPGYSLVQMATLMDVGERSTRTALKKLKDSGQVQRADNASSKEWRYELPDNPLQAPMRIKPQGIFAALGLP